MIHFPVSPFKPAPNRPQAVVGPATSVSQITIPAEVVAPSAAPTPVSAPPQPPVEVPSLPSMTQMAKNILGSVKNAATSAIQGHGIKVNAEEADRRLSICKTCPFFRHMDQRCSKCGCYMAVKTYLKAERCPVNKW